MINDPQALAMLALRRIHGRIAVLVNAGSHASEDADGDNFDPGALAGGDAIALGRVLRRAVERTWLTLELLFCQDATGPRLGRGGQTTLSAVFGNRCFDQLNATPGPFRKTIWRELHAARKAGPLAQGDVDVAALVQQMSGLTRPSEFRALHDLEWYVLWQTAGELARDGYPELRSLFEARSAEGEPLLIGLITSFIPFELELEGNTVRTEVGLSLLPEDHVRWLCEHSEPIEELLNEAYDGGRSGTPAEGAARVRQGQTYVQHGEYERAVIEFTAAIQADMTAAALYVHRGDALRLRGEYDRALTDYSQALRIDPQHLLARLNRGLVYRLTGRPEQALTDLTEALRLDARNVVALNGRGGAHADLKRFDEAIADHTQALRIDPSLAWAHQSRGDAYAGKGEYDRAVADYTQALRLNPHFPLAHANRGDAYRLSGDLDRAAADYTEALRLDPLNPRMFTSRGDTYRRQERYDLALADYSDAIRLDPTNPAGYLNRGIAYQLSGDYDRAVASFDQAEQFDAANPELFFQRALAYRDGNSYQEAIADLGRVIDLNPRDAIAFISRGTLYALTENVDEALSDFTEAIRLDPTSAQAHLERGRVYALCDEFDLALTDCSAAIRLNPHFVPAFLLRGGVLVRMGEPETALAEFDQAIKANPRYPRAYNDRGVAYSKLGRLDDAINDFTRAIELFPNNAQALANRGNAYQILKRHQDALQDYTQAVVVDSKYAATYSLVRGQVEAVRGNYRQALADYAVAIAIDPKSRTIRQARLEARSRLDTDFALAPATEEASADLGTTPEFVVDAAVAPPADDTEAVIELTDADLEDAPKAAPTVVRRAAPATKLAKPVVPVNESEQALYEVEERRFREAEEQARLKLLAERASALHRQNQADAAAQKAQAKTPKARRSKVDPDEVIERRRKYKQYAILAIGILVGGYWAVQGVWALIPRAKNPYKTYAAEQFVGEYAKDATSADEKFADQMLCLKGKLTIVRDKRLKVRDTAPQVYFDVPGQKEDLKVECLFEDPDMIAGLREEQEYVVVGKVEKFKPGKGIKLKGANILGGNEVKTAAGRQRSRADINVASAHMSKNSAVLPELFIHPIDEPTKIANSRTPGALDRPYAAVTGESEVGGDHIANPLKAHRSWRRADSSPWKWRTECGSC